MSVSDLAHEAAKRYCDAVPLRDWVVAGLERLGVPPSMREPAHVDALAQSWRRLMEEQIVEYFTIPELAALARFYATPEGASVMRKAPAWTAAVQPMLEAEAVAWARRLTSTGQAGGGDPAPRPIRYPPTTEPPLRARCTLAPRPGEVDTGQAPSALAALGLVRQQILYGATRENIPFTAAASVRFSWSLSAGKTAALMFAIASVKVPPLTSCFSRVVRSFSAGLAFFLFMVSSIEITRPSQRSEGRRRSSS